MAETHRAGESGAGLNPVDRARIITRHAAALERHGYRPQALFWQERGVQIARFGVIADAMLSAPASLLDVGCGFGDFYAWLHEHGMTPDFTGIDLSPDMIFAARSRFPQAQWLEGELLTVALPEAGYEVVTLSGALNEPIADADAYAQAVIARMWALARRQVIFNMLDNRNDEVARSPFLHGRVPETVERWCRRHTANVRVIEGYLPNDFTVVMGK
ncbi:Methyltransferase domain-containing protein [Sulfurivirga caldicuralii]|uniref:Methyltransferase domain-containing protein n=1 Tax=Sulfurivirga caldicuralii TaxID=364032 RepID=A0A1N6E447_9GAMM|nr:class I SAM-dependent methyltransferase [Sulfurivirga caldicuralii]SIN77697.1 Methyltransferase domain-containing protein [Sulfurivirga caldicuralii]